MYTFLSLSLSLSQYIYIYTYNYRGYFEVAYKRQRLAGRGGAEGSSSYCVLEICSCLFASSEIMKCRWLKWLYDHPMNGCLS